MLKSGFALYGETGIRNLSRIVAQKQEGPRQSDFSGGLYASIAAPEK